MEILTKELVFGLIGGLSLFLFGLVTLGEGLQKAAGNRIRKVIRAMTQNPFLSLLLGACLTILFQSSSATAVMVIGLLGASVITLTQALVILMGASLGTTFIAQVIAFHLEEYALLVIGIGFVLQHLATRRYVRYIGQAILGFGLVFIGLQTLSNAFHPLANYATFREYLSEVNKYPFWGFFIGLISTALLQSSNATIALLQSLAQQPVLTQHGYLALLPLSISVPILLGTNVGSCATAFFACIGRNRNTKRAVFAFILFNLLGSVLLLFFVPSFSRLIGWLTFHLANWYDSFKNSIFQGSIAVPWQNVDLIPREIAIAHTVFTIANIILWLPFIGLIVRWTNKIFIGKEKESKDGLEYLDIGMINTPSVAIDLAILEISHMSEIALQMLKSARYAFVKGTSQSIREVEEKEESVDDLQEKLTLYVSTLLTNNTITPNQSRFLAGLLHVINDVERVGDHAHNIACYAEEKIEEKLPFSELALNELEMLFGKIVDILVLSIDALRTHDPVLARKTLKREIIVDKLQEELRQNHINRLNQGRCWPGSGVIYVELLNNLERVADHAVNIAQVVLKEEADHRR
ncbi:MAG TPA: Na/Pi cotransporter family protein [Bacillota bacterium]|nr:Na/Pi cotransporter family protein [Bacillota bacterium]